MSDLSEESKVTQLKQALAALRRMRAKLDDIEERRTEPIAIIGIGCRIPGGVTGLESYWQLLENGVDAISEVPAERWDMDGYYDPDPQVPGKIYTRSAGLLDQIDQFDPHFFGISPREAADMDPQQRLLLEVSWEALENAGQAPDRLLGSSTGVFVGVSNNDYLQLTLGAYEEDQISAYVGTGNGPSILSGRLSYLLGLEGPSITVDTACSTSLVAVHLACRSLRSGECNMAIAGASNVLASPVTSIIFCRSHALSPSGRCKTFDAGADGYVRAEGCVVVVLKLLSKAIEDKDAILAVIRGTAVNQDGRSNGLTAPNQSAQEKVIMAALGDAKISPSQIGYIEAHGTGTPLGDPIEVQALSSVFGKGRSEKNPLVVGCVKTNVGHLESAAGLAGLTKVVLAMKHREIPAHLHLTKLNPHISVDFSFLVPTQAMPWPSGYERLIAGVSSFGFSGTNAHVILEEAPKAATEQVDAVRSSHLFTLSAKTEKAMEELAKRYEHHLETHSEDPLKDICFTSNNGRSHFDHRLAVIADTNEVLRTKLAGFNNGDLPAGVHRSRQKARGIPRLTFLFTGQGSQSVGMGRQMYETQPTFRKALDRCDELLRGRLDKPLLAVLYPQHGEESPLNETAYTQPALFALEYALYELWRSWGVEPSIVMGHSVGEYVAACVAGVFSLEDGIALIAERGRLIQALPKTGEMAAVFASEDRVAAAIAGHTDKVSIAVVNGPENTVISGERESIGRILKELEAEGIVAQRLNVSHAFHSPLMDPMLDAFEQAASKVAYSLPRVSLMSNVTGRPVVGDEVSNPGYWRRHVRAPVQFYRSMQALHERGEGIFLELGPHPVLLGMGAQCFPKGEEVWLPSLRRGQDEWQQMLESLGELYVRGSQVNWDGLHQDHRSQKINLPTYPFQRERCWIGSEGHKSHAKARYPGRDASDRRAHPLLGQRLFSPLRQVQFESRLSSKAFPFARDHRFFGTAIFPATAFLEMAMAAPAEALYSANQTLDDVAFIEALTLAEKEDKTVQFILSPGEAGEMSFQVFSLSDTGEEGWTSWRLHSTGKVHPGRKEPAATTSSSLRAIQARCREGVPVELFYQQLRELGVDYGSYMQGIECLWRGDQEALGKLQLPAPLALEASAYHFHPVLLDSCLQLFGAIMLRGLDESSGHSIYMPFAIESLRTYEKPDNHVWGHASILDGYGSSAETIKGDITVFSESGTVIAEIVGLQLKRASREMLARANQRLLGDWTYEVIWRAKPLHTVDHSHKQNAKASPGNWLILADDDGVGDSLKRRLEQLGETCALVYQGRRYGVPREKKQAIDPSQVDDIQLMLRQVQARSARGVLGIIHLWSLNAEIPKEDAVSEPQESQKILCGSVLHLVQALEKAGTDLSARLWLVTRGAQAVGSPPGLVALAQTPLLGLGAGIALEVPNLHCTRIDLDPSDDERGGEQELFDEIWLKDSENQVAFRNNARYVPRLVPSNVPEPGQRRDGISNNERHAPSLESQSSAELENATSMLRPDVTYLITGGLGDLGLLVARWMAERGARHLVLVGRGEPSANARDTINELQQTGALILVRRADVSQVGEVEDTLAEIHSTGFPLRGIVHCAGVVDDGMLPQQNWERFARVLTPKVKGTWNLHCLTLDTPLDFFVLFSSAVSLLGSVGQANYAAASAFLDAVAHYRRAKGLPALSINWGPWAGVGMAASLDGRTRERWTEQGVVMIEPSQGIQMLETIMQQDATEIVALPMHWSKLLRQFAKGEEPPLLAEIAQSSIPSEEVGSISNDPGGFARKLEQADPTDRHDLLFDYICELVIKVLRLSTSFELKPDQGLTDLGMDSLMAVELANRLKSALNCSLPPTLAFERPTIEALCNYLMDEILRLTTELSPSGNENEKIAGQTKELDDLERLSEEDAESALTAELERAGY